MFLGTSLSKTKFFLNVCRKKSIRIWLWSIGSIGCDAYFSALSVFANTVHYMKKYDKITKTPQKLHSDVICLIFGFTVKKHHLRNVIKMAQGRSWACELS